MGDIMDSYKVLSLNVDKLTYKSAVDMLTATDQTVVISSVNPEISLMCNNNIELRNFINSSTLKIADGIGTVLAIKHRYKVIVERITGIDLMEKILISELGKKKIFLYGSKPNIARQAMNNLNKQYECNIVDVCDGYIRDNNLLIEQINMSQAQILFVGLGCPKQELWIRDNMSQLSNIKIFMSVGGSFDVFAGSIKRAPQFIQKIHLEWLYRLVKQPSRIVRQMQLVKFVLMIYFRGSKCE